MAPTRQPVLARDIEVGCILFLPLESYKYNLKCMWSDVNDHPCHNRNCVLIPEGHRHPVVIIGKHYGFDEKTPGGLMLSFVQMTHGSPETPTTSGASEHTPYGHYGLTHDTKHLTFPESYRSRYWFRGLEFLQKGPGNFRIPHVFYAQLNDLVTMSMGLDAKAYDSRLDEGSYLRLMQRPNLKSQNYVADGYWKNSGPQPPSDGAAKYKTIPPSSGPCENSEEVSPNQPRGHHIADRENMRSHIAAPILDPAPQGRRRPGISSPSWRATNTSK